MRFVAFMLSMVLASGTAAAFDCVGVTFPSTVVICSDPELTRLTDERQAAINEARARVGEQAWPALWEDQKRWVRSYATACGVPPDRPAPSPVPPSIIECFRQAGEARIAYLRAYGLSAGTIVTSPGPALHTQELKISDVDEVPLEQKEGIFVIPVLINSAITLPFIIDSGAADVQIPVDVFSTLVRANTIVTTDLIGKRKYVLADGSTQDEPRFIIRELKVGNRILHNVEASVGPVAGELLLGQTFLSQFAEWTLDNQRHVLRLVARSGETANETVPAINGGSQPGPVATVAVPAAPRNLQPEGNRFQATGCGSIIDTVTRLEWYVGPDVDTTWPNAENWVKGLRACGKTWAMPSMYQLRTLFDRGEVAGTGYFTRGQNWPAHIDPIFSGIGRGSWVWAEGPNLGDDALAFNYNQGIRVQISQTNFYGTVRAFAIRQAD